MPGAHWKQEVDDHLNTASIILLLISSDFMASEFCSSVEMQRALARHEEGTAHVIPILLRPVDLEGSPFSTLKALPHNTQPVTTWNNKDKAFVDITQGIRRVLETFCSPSTESQISSPPTPITTSSLQGQQQIFRQHLQPQPTDARSKYLRYIQERYRFITLPLGLAEGFSLHAVFQPLRLRYNPLPAEDRQREKRRPLLGEPSPAGESPSIIAENGDDALKKSTQRRLVILGTPGTGKTTLLQSLMSNQLLQAQNDLSAPLPIFLSLSDLARGGLTLPQYLRQLGREVGLPDSALNFFWTAIEEGTAFICLDSLDEVTPRERPAMIRLINELATRPGNTWIVGSRFTDYKGGQFLRGRFTEWELLALDHRLRELLAKRLLPELARLLHPEKQENEMEPSAFVQALEDHQQASAWGDNPLLFSLAAILFVRTGTLPISRATLYQNVVDAILETREPDSTRRRLLRHIIAELALDLYRTKGRIFTRDTILTLLPAIRRRQDENWQTEEMATRIITSGILDVVAQETYGFRHQTFQEYLAAVALVRQLTSDDPMTREEGWSFVQSKRMYSRWNEIFQLMVGVLAQDDHGRSIQQCRRWLTALARQHREPEGDPGYQGLQLAMWSLPELVEIGTSGQKAHEREEIEQEIATSWIEILLAMEVESLYLQQLAIYIKLVSVSVLKNVVSRFITAFHEKEIQIRIVALATLHYLKEHVPFEPVLALLDDPDFQIRVAAVRLLQAMGKRISIPPFSLRFPMRILLSVNTLEAFWQNMI
jgi:GTPase SAR1 family protein